MKNCIARVSVSTLALAALAGIAEFASAAPIGPGFPAFVDVPASVVPGRVNRSGLATNGAFAAPIWAEDLATFAAPLATMMVNMNFSFSQCFSGGMIKPLTTLAGGAKISGASSAQWNEFSWYPLAVGGSDWAYEHVRAINKAAAPTVDTYVNDTFKNDPFSSWGGPVPAAGLGWEHPQFAETPLAGTGKLNDKAVGHRYAILYSGEPNAIDQDQISQMYTVLTNATYAYAPGDIYVVYGNGGGAGAGQIPLANLPLIPAANVMPATFMDLQGVFNTLTAIPTIGMADQLFFFSNDHGVVQTDRMNNRWLRSPRRPGNQSPMPSSPGNPYGQIPEYFNTSGADWEILPQYSDMYVPTPGALVVLSLVGLTAARRRRFTGAGSQG